MLLSHYGMLPRNLCCGIAAHIAAKMLPCYLDVAIITVICVSRQGHRRQGRTLTSLLPFSLYGIYRGPILSFVVLLMSSVRPQTYF